MLTIYSDADACPVKEEVYRVVRRYRMPVKGVANTPLRVPLGGSVELVVRPGFGAADDRIAEQAGARDTVITADIPHGRGLAKGAHEKAHVPPLPEKQEKEPCDRNVDFREP